jgi:glycosyltransferase involved in cell wall biosynthesis
MKVLVDGIIYRLQPHGGISRTYSEILPRMCDQEISLRITLLVEGAAKQSLPEHPQITKRQIPHVTRFMRPGRYWNPIKTRIRRVVQGCEVGNGEEEIWHSTYYTRPWKWRGKQVVTVHDMMPELFPIYFQGLENRQHRKEKRLCVERADVVICVSESTRRDVINIYGISSKSTVVIPHGYGAAFRWLENDVSKSLQLPIDKMFVLYVGSRARYKNVDMLLHAYSRWQLRKDIMLVFVGAAWSSDEENRLRALGIHQNVCLLSNVDDEFLSQLYNRAVALIYPSIYEGFGIPLLEAMACGCPIIASRIPSTIEVAGQCPIYFDPDDVDELLNTFDIVLFEGRQSERVKVGFGKVKPYSWDNTAAETLNVYRNIA